MESEAKQAEFFYRAWTWTETHWKQVVGGTVAVAVVALAAALVVWQQKEKELKANEALSALINRGAPITSAEPLLKTAAEYPGTSAAERALLLAAGKFFVEGKYPEARAHFEKYLSENPDSYLAPQAQLGIAASFDAEGKTNEAATAYASLIQRRPHDIVTPQAKLALARLYQAQGKLQEARDLYEAIGQASNNSIGSEAYVRYQDLINQHPELARPAPGASATPSAPAVPGLPGVNLQVPPVRPPVPANSTNR